MDTETPASSPKRSTRIWLSIAGLVIVVLCWGRIAPVGSDELDLSSPESRVEDAFQEANYTKLPSYTPDLVYIKDYSSTWISPGDFYQKEAYYTDKRVLDLSAKRFKAAGWKCTNYSPETMSASCSKANSAYVTIFMQDEYVVVSAESQDDS